MANHIISDLQLSINRSLNFHDALFVCHAKAQALATIALGDQFLIASPMNTQHAYLSALCDLLTEAQVLDESLMVELHTIRHKLTENLVDNSK